MSFGSKSILSFEATSIKTGKENTFLPPSLQWDYRLVKSIGILGFNASGKSNLLKALATMKYAVLYSGNSSTNVFQSTTIPFLLRKNNTDPTEFEVSFFLNNRKYRYGYKVLKGAVLEEWLFYAEPKIRENNLFYRNKRIINYSKTWNQEADNSIDSLFKRVQDHTLFLSVLSFLNVQPAVDILKWFQKIIIIENLDTDKFIDFATEKLRDDIFKSVFLRVIKDGNVGFEAFFDKKVSLSEKSGDVGVDFIEFMLLNELLPKDRYTVHTIHKIFDENGNEAGTVQFDLRKQESEGTKKFFGIIGLFLDSIVNKRILMIDELDSKFHFALYETLVRFFNNSSFNQYGSQLIYTSHNTTLLDRNKIRRDQFYSLEKNLHGESVLKRFHEKGSTLRTDASLLKEYEQRTLKKKQRDDYNLFSGLLDFPDF
ncbi:AAA family ATPase [Parafilimonas sp.]|uniref:AAA family ATPase n=1 Tax=Parafilimonas sp. TaxID=1969739 RepID=UPI003F7F6B23